MRDFDETRDFIGQIQHARSPAAICEKLLSVTSRFGLSTVCAGTIPPRGTAPQEQVGNLILNTWPAEWLDRYVARNYVDHDPVVVHAIGAGRAMSWSEARSMRGGNSRMASEMFGDARSFKLVDGVAFAISTLDGGMVIMSYGGETIDLSPEDLGKISFISAYAVGHALSLRGEDRFRDLSPAQKECVHWAARGKSRQEMSDLMAMSGEEIDQLLSHARATLGPGHMLNRFGARPRLTPREQECLQWAALGKSEWEVSQILGISEHTAEKHLLNAKTKLGAANRVQAVAEAFRCGLLE